MRGFGADAPGVVMDRVDQRLLGACERIEMLAAQAYRKLATIHATDRELAMLWAKTSKEEENHAAQFRLSPVALAEMVGSVRVRLADAMDATNRLVAFLRRCDTTPPGPVEALREMVDFEQWLEKFHMDSAAAFTSPRHQALFRAMMRADRDHLAALQAALARRTGGG